MREKFGFTYGYDVGYVGANNLWVWYEHEKYYEFGEDDGFNNFKVPYLVCLDQGAFSYKGIPLNERDPIGLPLTTNTSSIACEMHWDKRCLKL